MKKFIDLYTSTPQTNIVPEEIMNFYKNKVPNLLIEIWKKEGFSLFNKGLFQLVNPKQYEENLWTWLGKEVPYYAPFAITGFGDIFYFKNLPQDDFNVEAGLKEEICLIDIQHRRIKHLTWDLESFFNDWLTNEENRKEWLGEDLFNQALLIKGKLTTNEIFTFTPALALGGVKELNYLQKGNAIVYQKLIFQLSN